MSPGRAVEVEICVHGGVGFGCGCCGGDSEHSGCDGVNHIPFHDASFLDSGLDDRLH